MKSSLTISYILQTLISINYTPEKLDQVKFVLNNFSFFQNTKNKTAVKLTAVSCAPVVEVKIKRPDTKYQLGFSVQNGVVSPHL